MLASTSALPNQILMSRRKSI